MLERRAENLRTRFPVAGALLNEELLERVAIDGVVGAPTSLRYNSFFFEADTRSCSAATACNSIISRIIYRGVWGTGYYFARKSNAILGVQCAVSGKYKGIDRSAVQQPTTLGSALSSSGRVSSHC